MLTVYKHKCNAEMFFDMNGIDYEFADNDVDLYVTTTFNEIDANVRYKQLLFLEIYHNFEDQIKHYTKWLENNPSINAVFICNAEDGCNLHPRILFYDFLYNRTKSYYQHIGYKPTTPLWYYAGKDCYELNEIIDRHRDFIFLGLNRTYRNKLHIRQMINFFLWRHRDKGYIGDAEVSELYLPPHGTPMGTTGYMPVKNEFYDNSYISIYGETIEYGTSVAITEKTYEPLLKGHFILPFSTRHFMQQLKFEGFKFPSFINYEYDNIIDYITRTQFYFSEMQRLMNIPLDQWRKHYNDNLDILNHNRNIILNRPMRKLSVQQILIA